MGVQPGGTLTFLFTDIEGSTRRWQDDAERMRVALARHDSLLADAIAHHGGSLFKHTGDGVCAVFASAVDAVAAAVRAQRALTAEAEGASDGLRVRMGLHTGEAEERDGDYFGPALNRAARIMGVGHGGQILVSGPTAALLADSLPPDLALVDLGDHRLRDLVNTERLHQVAAPGLADQLPPVRSLDAFEHNLPVQRTSFVGRMEELEAVVARLGSASLVTLAGAGGAGKTRLALEAAAAILDRPADGVFFVDLSPIADGELIAPAVAAAVGLQRGGGAGGAGSEPLEDLFAFLARRQLLLVLDNCEHVVDDAAAVVDEILARAPGITILATSREPLSVEGEHVIRVGSLAIGDGAGEAVQLFNDRAAAVVHDFEAEAHRGAVADICRRLDGIPLAIELAAAQVAHLAPEEIASRLDDRFELLTGGRRRVQRQQTLEATLDWSHDLLGDDERTTLRRLSVFAGDFALDDAEAVVADESLGRSRVLRLVAGLVEKSLVASAEQQGSTRYRLLETVRLYGLQRLTASGEATVIRDRHRDHYIAVVDAIDVFDRVDDMASAERVWRDVDNLRAALEWSESKDRPDLVARLVAGSLGLWWIHGLGDEGLRWSSAALAAESMPGGPPVDTDVLVLVRLVRGISLMINGDLIGTRVEFEAAAARPASTEVSFFARSWLGFSSMPDRARAEDLLLSVEAEAEAGDGSLAKWGGFARFLLGAISLFHADPEKAIDDLHLAKAKLVERESSFAGFFRLIWQAAAFHVVGRQEEARGAIAALSGLEFLRAWASYNPFWITALVDAADRRDSAPAAIRATIETVRRHGLPLADRDCLLACVALAWHEGRPEHAAFLIGTVRQTDPYLVLRSPASFAVYAHYAALLRQSLDPEVRRERRRAGSITPVDVAIEAELAAFEPREVADGF